MLKQTNIKTANFLEKSPNETAIISSEQDPQLDGHFLFLCHSQHQESFRKTHSHLPYKVLYVEREDDLLISCLKNPPWAVFVDTYTATRLGSQSISRLFNLRVNWPIVRCVMHFPTEARVICIEPGKMDVLQNAMQAIASGDPSWKHPRHRRHYLRLDLKCRVRLKRIGDNQWYRGNTLTLSAGGAFITSAIDLSIAGDCLQLELRDLKDTPFNLLANVVWSQRWEDSPELPGVGVRFSPECITEELKCAIAQPAHLGLFS